MSTSTILNAKLDRTDSSTPWGFRLYGGVDFGVPLTIQKVNPGSLAAGCGLQIGDIVIKIGGTSTERLRHQDAQEQIGLAGNSLELSLERSDGSLPTLPNAPKPDAAPSHTSFNKPKAPSRPIHDARKAETGAGASKQLVDDSHQAKVSDMFHEEDRPAVQSKSFRALQEMLEKGEVTGLKQYQQRKDGPAPQDNAAEAAATARSDELPVETERKKIVVPLKPFKPAAPSHAMPAPSHAPPPSSHAPESFSSPRFAAGSTNAMVEVNLADYNPKPESSTNVPTKSTFGVTARPFGAPTERRSSKDFISSATSHLGLLDKTAKAEKDADVFTDEAKAPEAGSSSRDEIHDDGAARKTITISGGRAKRNQMLSPVAAPPTSSASDLDYKPPSNIELVTERPFPRRDEYSVVGVEFHYKEDEGTKAVRQIEEELKGDSAPSPPSTKTSSITWQPQVPTGTRTPKFGQRGEARTLTPRTGTTPQCASCGVTIRGPFVMALDKSWCPEHFVCANPNCHRSLVDVGFVEEQGQLLCEKDYEMYFAPHCARCDVPIVGDMMSALGAKYHPSCFLCTHCRHPIGEGKFHMVNNEPYCETDWAIMFATKCPSCRFPVEPGDRWVEALTQMWHTECFRCAECETHLEYQSFIAKAGRPYCKKHM